ncbi:MAG: Ig-like domain-containing protein [Prevotellaceae bacterium]|jgi:UDP-2,3-diacylglucosamine pyrophosphatase LpxH|nr:Ig-like domain-containing protein [Prevotellaceae bacterium]
MEKKYLWRLLFLSATLAVACSEKKELPGSEKEDTAVGVKVSSIRMANPPANNVIRLFKGGTQDIAVEVLPKNAANKSLSFESSNEAVFTVSATELPNVLRMAGVEEGEEYVTVWAQDSSGVSVEWGVIVTDTTPPTLVQALELSVEFSGLYAGDTLRIAAQALPENATNKAVRYASSDSSVLTVTDGGLVTAVAQGEASITVSAADGSGVTTSVAFSVYPTPSYSSADAFQTNAPNPAKLAASNADGPYVFYQADGSAQVVTVDGGGNVQIRSIPRSELANTELEVTSHYGTVTFRFKLRPRLTRQPHKVGAAKKVFVISDLHGTLKPYIDALKQGGVINDSYEWTYGANQMVVIGDHFDRGNDVPALFWLTYKLQTEARAAGGDVFFTLGNHEAMAMVGTNSSSDYVYAKYNNLAKSLFGSSTSASQTCPKLHGKGTEIGRWIGVCNTVQVVGDNLYVHGGFGEEFYKRNYTLPFVNETILATLYSSSARSADSHAEWLYGSSTSAAGGCGPLWYRGMGGGTATGAPLLTQATVENMLKRYDVKRFIVGHCIRTNIERAFDNKVIRVNVNNYENPTTGRTTSSRAIVIEGNKVTVLWGDNTKNVVWQYE